MAEHTAQRHRSYLRDRQDEDSARVSFAELFFDLVFVFAVTQLSQYLLNHLEAEGVFRGSVLFMATWWLWITTSWATNRLDPDRSLVRMLIFALMVVGLPFAISIPLAYEGLGLLFAVTYVAMQLGRSVFMVWALKDEDDGQRATFERVSIWFVISGVLWITGGFLDGDLRSALWTVALMLDIGVPWMGFWVPGHGRSPASEWDIEGEHLAERCALFIIIGLGESLLVTGQRMATLEWDAVTMTAFAVALAGSLVMWWIYFDEGAKRGTEAIERSADPGRLARFAYTYVHLPIVAGIVLSAVGDKLLLAHPEDTPGLASTLVLLGGPAVFLAGNFLFKDATSHRWPVSHLIGLIALAAALPVAGLFSTLGLAAYATAALVAVAVLERLLRRSRAGARSLIE
ncbi:low temperature requirement protein A [Rubellimicrobium arenae]|uniref:low temperature requirement protein A n=1 Tax=Rubellimicrobium arenae TaxID=2817372 RepID=UPI001B301213|nr:low temperature requirement protein A [Rubellimicrobium arenae]